MTVAATSTGLYSKAKQRMLNKMGKRTPLTKNARVDHVTPRLQEIAQTRKETATLLKSFRRHYRKTLLAGTELIIHLFATWASEVGECGYVDELDTYVREKSEEEMGIVTEVSDDVRTVMERLQSVSTLFDEALRRGCEKPFEGFEEGALLRGVQEAKEEYKAGRTRYSDTMINYKSGLSSPQDLEMARQDYEKLTKDLESNMKRYEDEWHKQLFTGISECVTLHLDYIQTVSDTLSDLEIWTPSLSLNLQAMKQTADKTRKTHLENSLLASETAAPHTLLTHTRSTPGGSWRSTCSLRHRTVGSRQSTVSDDSQGIGTGQVFICASASSDTSDFRPYM